MNTFRQKIVIGTVAAVLVAGGGFFGVMHTMAQADEPQSTTDGSDQGNLKHRFFDKLDKVKGEIGKKFEARRGGPNGEGKGFMFGGAFMPRIEELLGIDKQTFLDAVKEGKTLAQIAQEQKGWSADELKQKIEDAINSKLSEAVANGKLTQEQADKIKENEAAMIDKLLNQPMKPMDKRPDMDGRGHGFGPHPGGMMPGGPKGQMGPIGPMGPMFGMNDTLTTDLGITKDELEAGLKSGKSLAEIAQEKGISEDVLIQKIKDGMTDRIKKMVEMKHQPRADKKPAPTDNSSNPPAAG
jgi:predicted DNA-binding protein YlxM (UPF0122 family)